MTRKLRYFPVSYATRTVNGLFPVELSGLMLMALALCLTTLTFGFQALAAGGNRNGIPAFPFLMFGAVGLLASAGDLRVIRSGALRGAPRLARHLWRMCWALWIAASSFFLGPRARVAKIIPEPLLNPALLALPVLAVFVIMLYWLWRVRVSPAYTVAAVYDRRYFVDSRKNRRS